MPNIESDPWSRSRLGQPFLFLKGCSHLKTLVGAYFVVEFYSFFREFSHFFYILVISIEQPSVLNRVVHSLGKCVVKRVTGLRHADLNAIYLQQGHIFVAAVLYATV